VFVDTVFCIHEILPSMAKRHFMYNYKITEIHDSLLFRPVGSSDDSVDTMATHHRGNHVVTNHRGWNAIM